jgi:rare lipoprotein A
MGSLIVVTNLKTGQSSAMRITDRGPFAEDRIIDLTIASAKATGVYRAGLVQVRVDVYRTPEAHRDRRPLVRADRRIHNPSARPIGSSSNFERKYPASNVIEFPGEESYWVRIRPQGDNRELAEAIARKLRPARAKPS